MTQQRIIRLPEVMNQTGLTRTTLYIMMNNGKFPKNVVLHERSVGWSEIEVQEWIAQKLQDKQSKDSTELV